MQPPTTEVSHNADEARYELSAGGEVIGIADYRLIDDRVAMFHHTYVDPPLRGRGHAHQLVREALDDVRRRGLRVRAVCWYVDQFIVEHPEYADLRA